jgi:hypothetical protein
MEGFVDEKDNKYWEEKNTLYWEVTGVKDWRQVLKSIQEWRESCPEKIQDPKRIADAVKKNIAEWEAGRRQAWYRGRYGAAVNWVLMWDTLKDIEKKYSVDALSSLRQQRFRLAFEAGQNAAKARKEKGLGNGILDLYDAFIAGFDEGPSKFVWIELNEKCMHYWNLRCVNYQYFRQLGKTDAEIKEMAPFYCLVDQGYMQGFNPNFEVFPYPRIQMAGDSHCSLRIEDHGPEWGASIEYRG